MNCLLFKMILIYSSTVSKKIDKYGSIRRTNESISLHKIRHTIVKRPIFLVECN